MNKWLRIWVGSGLLLALVFGCGGSGNQSDAGKSSKSQSKGTGGKSATSHAGTGGNASHGTGGSPAVNAGDASLDAETPGEPADSGAQTIDGATADAGVSGADASSEDGGTSGPTPPGTAIAAGETKTIGAAGGSFSSADGVVTLTFPEGALASDTLIGIHMLTNTAPNALGNAYDLRSEAMNFAKPVQVTFQVSADDLAMTGAIDGVDIGYQDPQGLWHWFGGQQRDANANTVTISTTHFTPYAKRGKMFTVKQPPPIVAAHYMINATFSFKQILVCQVETADIFDGFIVTVYQDATGAVTLPTGVDDRATTVLNETFLKDTYPEGGSVKWTSAPEVFDSVGSSVAYDAVTHLITVTIMNASNIGGCEATINGVLTSVPVSSGCPIAGNPFEVVFDPSKVPISSPIDADGFAYDITKF